jgi:PAS domain S-box-containing protein
MRLFVMKGHLEEDFPTMKKPTYEQLEQRVKELEEESEEKYRSILESIEDGYYELDDTGNFTFVNDSFCKIGGYSKDEILGMHSRRFVDEDNFRKVTKAFDEVLTTGKPTRGFNCEILDKQGNKRYVEVSISQRKDSKGQPTGWRGFMSDVTDRKHAEEALRASEEKYRVITENVTDVVWEAGLDGSIKFLSPSFESSTGFNIEEGISMNVRNFITPDSLERNRDFFREQLRKERERRGKYYPPVVLELEQYRKDGPTFWSEVSIKFVRDEEGNPVGITGVARDISDRKRMEEEKQALEAQLQYAQKMESLGTLAGGLAHNFNNLLMAIIGNASVMLLDVDLNHPHYRNLKSIEKQVLNGSKLTRQLLGYAREGRYELKPINLNQLVKETADTFGTTRKEIIVHQEFAENLNRVEVDQGQIEQVLLNLYVNAADAMPGGGDLFIKTMNVTNKDMRGKPYAPKPGNYVLLTVRDTGSGMDKKTMDRIFDPFFTTKGLAQGTGLGLASAYGIIKGHGGYIDVFSKKGKGATFEIYLPATKKAAEEEKELSGEFVEAQDTVLLVDDEEFVLDAGEQMLRRLGYEVLVANSGQEALALYEKNHAKIDMVLLDMVMPGMGGGETYDRMREIDPTVKVLLSSGYSIDGEATEILERGCDGFIQKPFDLGTLSQDVREILDKKKTNKSPISPNQQVIRS